MGLSIRSPNYYFLMRGRAYIRDQSGYSRKIAPVKAVAFKVRTNQFLGIKRMLLNDLTASLSDLFLHFVMPEQKSGRVEYAIQGLGFPRWN